MIPEARPVLQVPPGSRVGIFSQAPGNLAHQAGKPFADPSGDRLRDWLGVSPAEFYDSGIFAIIPMAFCFPGYDGTGRTGKGGDRPPPKLCAETWRVRMMEAVLRDLKLVLLVGAYAQNWHAPEEKGLKLTDRVGGWRNAISRAEHENGPVRLPLPHPSWRNSGWLKKNPWFEAETVPWIRAAVRAELDQ